jgi:hypothetical protein
MVARDPDGRNWFFIQGRYEWHEGNKFGRLRSDFTHMISFQKTGVNSEGGTVGVLILWEQNKVAAWEMSDVFSGGVEGKPPVPDGTYKINLATPRAVAHGDSALTEHKRNADDVELRAYHAGMQEIPEVITDRYGVRLDFRAEWGSVRAFMAPDPATQKAAGKDAQGIYLHGKALVRKTTHGCLCNRTENVLRALKDLQDQKDHPGRVPVWVMTMQAPQKAQ